MFPLKSQTCFPDVGEAWKGGVGGEINQERVPL
jgi:hypothetical protein